MKFKIIVALLVLCLLTIGSVNASDNLTDDTLSSDVTDDSICHDDSNINEKISTKNTVNKNDDLKTINIEETIDKNINNASETTITKPKDPTKLKNSAKQDIHRESYYDEDNEIEVYIKDDEDIYTEESTLVNVEVYGSASGLLKIYLNNNLKEAYAITNGYFYDDETWMDLTLYDLGITTDGTYPLKVTFTPNGGYEKELAKQTINYKYRPVYVEIDDERLYNTNSTAIYLESYSETYTGNIKIYVNGNQRKTFKVTHGEIEEETIYENWLYLTLADLGITTTGTYTIQVKFTYNSAEKELAQKTINYEYTPFVADINSNPYTSHKKIIEVYSYSNGNDNGILKVKVENIERKYTISKGKINGETYLELSLNDFGINDEGYYDVTVTYTPSGGLEKELANDLINYEYIPFETYLYDDSEELGIESHTDESGILKIYVNNNPNIYTINNGCFNDEYELHIPVNQLGMINSGTYQLKFTFTPYGENEKEFDRTTYTKTNGPTPEKNNPVTPNINTQLTTNPSNTNQNPQNTISSTKTNKQLK